jgi:hypothetical protein
MPGSRRIARWSTRSYVMSPFVNERAMELVVREIEEVQEALSR